MMLKAERVPLVVQLSTLYLLQVSVILASYSSWQKLMLMLNIQYLSSGRQTFKFVEAMAPQILTTRPRRSSPR